VPRNTTVNSAGILRGLGITGGEGFASIADGPAQPVFTVGGASPFETERFQPRAMAGAIVTNLLAAPLGTIPALQITSLGQAGIVIDDLRLESITLGGGPAFAGIPEGAWVIVSSRDVLLGAVPRYPINGAVIGVTNLGGVGVRSPVTAGTRDTPGSFGVFLSPNFQIAPPATWFVPAGFDLTFQLNSITTAGNIPVGSVQLGWREVTGIGTGGFVRGT